MPLVRIAEYRVFRRRSDVDTSQVLKGVLDVAVLAVVAQEDAYGYDVVRRLREAAGEVA